jgi:hypothetical protein
MTLWLCLPRMAASPMILIARCTASIANACAACYRINGDPGYPSRPIREEVVPFQARRHLPPWTSSEPTHKNAFMILSNALCIHGRNPMQIEAYIVMVEMVDFIRVSLPLLFMSCPFHRGAYRRHCLSLAAGMTLVIFLPTEEPQDT